MNKLCTLYLDPGTYTLTITDNSNNSVTDEDFVIGLNSETIAFNVAQSSPETFSQSNGEAAISGITINGVPSTNPITNYTCQLDGVPFNNFNGNIITGLSAGNHTLTLYDGNCQSANVGFTIYNTNCTANFKLTAITDPIQYNVPDSGAITVFATGGNFNLPYTFLMLDKTQDSAVGIIDSSYRFDNLDSGSYTITAHDSAGCPTDTISVMVPYCTGLLQTNRLVTPADYGKNDGSAKLFVSGGVAPYTFKLLDNSYHLIGTGTNDSTFTFDSLGAGNYRVSYMDSYGCDLLRYQANFTYQIYFAITNKCNPITDSLFVTQTDSTGGYISGYITGGTSPYNIRIYDAANVVVDSVFGIGTANFSSTQELSFGKYYVVVSDSINCTNRDSISLIVLADCYGVVNGTAFLDDCGYCVGGTTGLTTCYIDCNFVPSGSAYFDDCGICVGGTTGNVPCTGGIGSQDNAGTWENLNNANCMGCTPPTSYYFSNFDYCRVQCSSKARYLKDPKDIYSPYPERINQNNTPLCGMVCLAYYLAKNKPTYYSQMVTDLTTNGFTTNTPTGARIYANYPPSDDPLAQVNPASTTYPHWPNMAKIPQVDCILLSSLKNTFLNIYGKFYEPTNTYKASDGTRSAKGYSSDLELKYEMVAWLGMKNVSLSIAGAVPYTALGNLQQIDALYHQNPGYTIFMFIDAHMLGGISYIPNWTGIPTPVANHAITYAGDFSTDGTNVYFSAVTWGYKTKYSVPISTLNSDFISYVVGQ